MIVDYSRILARHDAINLRLEGWGRYIVARPVYSVHPMFRFYQSKARQWEMPNIQPQGNPNDHMEIERAVGHLPPTQRTCIRWAYAYPWVPVTAVRRELGLSKQDLAWMLDSGRDMVMNRLKST